MEYGNGKDTDGKCCFCQDLPEVGGGPDGENAPVRYALCKKCNVFYCKGCLETYCQQYGSKCPTCREPTRFTRKTM